MKIAQKAGTPDHFQVTLNQQDRLVVFVGGLADQAEASGDMDVFAWLDIAAALLADGCTVQQADRSLLGAGFPAISGIVAGATCARCGGYHLFNHLEFSTCKL